MPGLVKSIPKMMREAPIAAVMVRQPTTLRVKNMHGTNKIPQMAGNKRIET